MTRFAYCIAFVATEVSVLSRTLVGNFRERAKTMDSKNIYIVACSKLDTVQWEKEDGAESEYRYIGTGNEFRKELARKVLSSHFENDDLYIVTDRHQSKTISKVEAVEALKESTLSSGAIIVDFDFRYFFMVNNVGSYRIGVKR